MNILPLFLWILEAQLKIQMSLIGTEFKQLFDLKNGSTHWLTGNIGFCMISAVKNLAIGWQMMLVQHYFSTSGWQVDIHFK